MRKCMHVVTAAVASLSSMYPRQCWRYLFIYTVHTFTSVCFYGGDWTKSKGYLPVFGLTVWIEASSQPRIIHGWPHTACPLYHSSLSTHSLTLSLLCAFRCFVYFLVSLFTISMFFPPGLSCITYIFDLAKSW